MEEILKVLNYQPAEILSGNLENPLPAITFFFVNHPLDEARAQLWNLFKGWLYTAAELPDSTELEDMLFFYEQLVEMLNLSYVYTEMENQKNKELS